MPYFEEEYVLERDEEVLKKNWTGHARAMRWNEEQRIARELYAKICKEIKDGHPERE